MPLVVKNVEAVGADTIQSNFSLKNALPIHGVRFFDATLSATPPFYATTLTIPMASSAQGVWVNAGPALTTGITNGVTVTAGAFNILTEGRYQVSIDAFIAQLDGSVRNIGLGFAVNNNVGTLPIGTIPVSASAIAQTANRGVQFSGHRFLNLTVGNTVSLFCIAVRESGTAPVNFAIQSMRFSIVRLDGSFVVGEV